MKKGKKELKCLNHLRTESLLLISILSIFLLVLASPFGASGLENYPPIIDYKVIEKLQNHETVSVVVSLKDSSGIKIKPSDMNPLKTLRRKWKINERIKSEVLLSLSESEFIVESEFSNGRGFTGRITNQGLEKLKNNPYVSRIYTPMAYRLLLSESVVLINTTRVWLEQTNGINITGEGQTICIIDSGVDSGHPDLAGKIVKEYCYCQGTAGPSGCCPNGSEEDENATDEIGHGTHIAGILVSQNQTYKGVAPGANIAVVKVVDSNGQINDTDIVKAVDWCVNKSKAYNISAISISIGSEDVYNDASLCDSFPLGEAVNDAYNAKIFVVAASGNDANTTGISSPACVSGAASVGMTYDFSSVQVDWPSCYDLGVNADTMACANNRCELLDVLAPGAKITSLRAKDLCPDDCIDCIGNYMCCSGTSEAAPHVAGAAALLIQYEKLKNNDSLTPDEIIARWKDTGKLINDSHEYSNTSGTNLIFSRIDIYSALFPIDVYDFQRLQASNTYNIFSFKIKNSYNNKTKDVSWSFDIGNGTIVTSDDNITLPPGNTSFVYFEHNYSDGDIYMVEASASSGDVSDSETMALTLGDIIAYDLKEIYVNGKERVFNFKILNNMNETRYVNWTMYLEAETIHSDQSSALEPGNETLVYFHYNYTRAKEYAVIANATSGSITDQTNKILVNVS